LRVQFDARQGRFDAWRHDRADDGLASTIAGLGRFYRYGNLLAAAFVISESTGPQNANINV